MEFVKIITSQYNSYIYEDVTNTKMIILASFLLSDASVHPLSFKNWYLYADNDETNGNCTALERYNGYVTLQGLFSEDEVPTILTMTKDQFLKLLDDWEEKVCKLMPEEIMIKYENDEYIIETK